MAGMADEDDVAAGLDQPLGLAMDLADQGAGRVEIIEAARLGGGRHDLGHAMGGKDHRAAVRHLVQLLDEHRAQPAQPVDDEAVMDDFVPDIDRRPEALDRQLDDLDRAIDARAKAARRRDQEVEWQAWGAIGGRCKASLAAMLGASYERGRIGPRVEQRK